MVARRAHLLENTLLSGINVGGDADTTGAMMGALLGALHGWAAFPEEWKEGLEASGRLRAEAEALVERLPPAA
jgi:ADP-ribosylglycohydrolase